MLSRRQRPRILYILINLVVLIAFLYPHEAKAQSCALRINEVLYDPTPDFSQISEWVELYVAADIAADTTFFITDQEGSVVQDYEKVFTVSGGTAAETYLVIHNDGNPGDDGTIIDVGNGTYTSIHYYVGNGVSTLRNDGDDIALYVGTDAATGVPCDFMQYNGGNSGIPPNFTWDTSCADPNSPDAVSISLDQNGVNSDSACDWAASGDNSTRDPGLPITYFPSSLGWNNNTTPTAVSLLSLSAGRYQTPIFLLSVVAVIILATITSRTIRTSHSPRQRRLG